MEAQRSRRVLLTEQRDEMQRKLRELGALSAAMQKKFDNKPQSALQKLLNETKKSLKDFGAVNKKALDQYVQFKEQQVRPLPSPSGPPSPLLGAAGSAEEGAG